jgi:ATP-binding cassette subfamily B protein
MAMHMGNVDPDDLLGKAYDPRIARRLLGTIAPYRARAIAAALCMLGAALTDLILEVFRLGS